MNGDFSVLIIALVLESESSVCQSDARRTDGCHARDFRLMDVNRLIGKFCFGCQATKSPLR